MSHTAKTYHEAGFTFEQVVRIKSSLEQADRGELVSEETVWKNIQNNRKIYA